MLTWDEQGQIDFGNRAHRQNHYAKHQFWVSCYLEWYDSDVDGVDIELGASTHPRWPLEGPGSRKFYKITEVSI